MASEPLNQILEEETISLSCGESDTKLIEPEEDLNITRPYSIIDELMDSPSNHSTKHQTSTIFSTISTISYPLATMTTTTAPSTINTTTPISTPIISHDKMQQNTTAAHIQFTAPAPPSTIISKPTTTPSNRSSSPSKHIPFNFHFIPSRPNYITNLNLPMKLDKLCRDIQLSSKVSIIKVVEDHLKKQTKIKKTNKNKSKKATTYKLRFTPREHHHPPQHLIQLTPPQSFKTLSQYPNISPPPQPHTRTNQSITLSLQPAPNSTHYYNAPLPSISNQTPTT